MPSYSVTVDEIAKKDKQPTVEESMAVTGWQPTPEQVERKRKRDQRIQDMITFRAPRVAAWQKVIEYVEAERKQDPNDPSRESFTLPYAHIYLDTRLAEEAENTPNYIYTPVEPTDTWRVEILNEVRKHVDNKVNMLAKWQTWNSHKDMFGTGIVRTGYRLTMRTIKERKAGEEDEYEEKRVPIYDDLFVENVSPFNFYVDPNAYSLNDAEDCAEVAIMSYNVFWGLYGQDDRYINIDKVKAGDTYRLPDGVPLFQDQISPDQVVRVEYFNKYLDQWVTEFNGVECRCSPLPDDHKELPYADLHNHAHFGGSQTNSTGSTTTVSNTGLREIFWRKGDVEKIMDAIELRNGFFRVAADGAKLANVNIIATEGTFTLDTTMSDWYNGKPAIGAKGKLEILPLGRVDGSYQVIAAEIDQLITKIIGVDPSVLTDTKTKTATETAIKRETMLKRIKRNIIFNESLGILRFGRLMLANIQQYYSIPELVRLTGEEDLKKFHAVVDDPTTGKPMFGKRYRYIRSEKKYKEVKKGTRIDLVESDEGANSFIARPELIRSSEVDVRTDMESTLSASRELDKARCMEAVQLGLSIAAQGAAGAVPPEAMPNLKYFMEKWVAAMGWDKEKALGKGRIDVTEDQTQKFMDLIKGQQQEQQPQVAPAQPMPTMPMPQQSPQIGDMAQKSLSIPSM